MTDLQIEAARRLQYKIANAQLNRWPYAHFYLENVFPDEFYKQILFTLPASNDYTSGDSDYHGRKFAHNLRTDLFSFMLTKEFMLSVVSAFAPEFRKRFPDGSFNPKMDLRLVLDSKNYSIGPHTDARWKVVSLLFYLPPDDHLKDLGTSIYVCKDPSFRCPGGPHHTFEPFDKVWTAPFLPNSCFGFFKTDNSFHGVEPITIPCRRDVLLWNLYDKAVKR